MTVFVNKVTGNSGSFDVRTVTDFDEPSVTAATAPSIVALAQSQIALALTDKNTFKTIDVTGVVQLALSLSSPVLPLEIAANSIDGLNAKFDSKENGARSHPPQLEITLGATSATITDGSVGNADLANDAVTSAKILDGTITGADVADRSLRNDDIDFSTGPLSVNTAVGDSALLHNTIGDENTAVGDSALSGNMQGSRNTALGSAALAANTDAADNTAVGWHALSFSTLGASNTAVGSGALAELDGGSNNVAVGKAALNSVTTGSDNVALGTNALRDCCICPRGQELPFERLKSMGTAHGGGEQMRLYRCRQFKDCPVRWQCSRDANGRPVSIGRFHGPLARQREKRRTAETQAVLRRRKQIVEAPYGFIKEALGFRRFTVAGLEQVRVQWSLICTAFNLRKLLPHWRNRKLVFA